MEVPHTAPHTVAMASESMARSMLGTSPFSVSRFPRAQAPYRVPMVSNMSTRQKARAVVMTISTSSVTLWVAR